MENKTFVIVGVSSGIGLALCEHFLAQGNRVIGIGRKSSIQNQSFGFLSLDLLDEDAIEQFDFPQLDDFVFIYNSGVLGEILPISAQSDSNAKAVFQVNYLAAVTLTKKVLKQDSCKQIIYISSGAAKRAIPSWAQYCASKAALDMFAETLQLELQAEKADLIVRSIAPGVVDTPMQAQIRSTSEEDFPSVQNFKDLHENGDLVSPEIVAEKLAKVIGAPQNFEGVCLSLRDVE
jgi:benzil reductase ((S)-benzoin forming)